MALPNGIVTRTVSGAIFCGLIIGAIVWNPLAVSILFAGIMVLGLLELYKLARMGGIKPAVVPGIVLALLIYAFVWIPYFPIGGLNFDNTQLLEILLLLICIAPIAIACSEIFAKNDKPLANVAVTILGSLYLAIPLGFLSAFINTTPDYIADSYYGNEQLLGFFILLWASDTGAYLAGSTMGKHKLFERLSPKKTWEGAIGGAVLAMGTACLLFYLFETSDLLHWIIMAIVVVVFGNLGDLFESLIKRSVGAKDSGTIMPGHGGVLDRFDSALFAAPMVLLVFVFIDRL